MIIYPAFFIVPGIALLFGATAGTRFFWLFPVMILGVFLPAVLGRFRLLAVMAGGVLVGRLIMGDIGILSAGLFVAGACLLMTGTSALCPRCGTHISSRDQAWRGGPPAQWCYICGRSRARVWPFQYALHPEDWDGQYHDDGGGPSSVDSIVDWWRDIAYRRMKKRRHLT